MSMMECKAMWKNGPAVYVGEAYTSQQCHVCHAMWRRRTQFSFECNACGRSGNADMNSVLNIEQRWEWFLLPVGRNGTDSIRPINQAV